MSDAQTNLAGAALAIALVALVTTLTQLLQQSFTTAEGFRRCQPSVLGPWAKFTRRRWRFQEFRFETRYTVPAITIQEKRSAKDIWPKEVWDTALPPRPSLRLIYSSLAISEETASWLLFLKALEVSTIMTVILIRPKSQEFPATTELGFETKQDMGTPSKEKMKNTFLNWLLHRNRKIQELPTTSNWDGKVNSTESIHSNLLPKSCSAVQVTPRERSWDFMPADVIRPLAITNVGDIGILARRLGMKWIEFRPSDGIMKAEGGGHVFTSTYIRSVGTILHYLYSGEQYLLGSNPTLSPPLHTDDSLQKLYIPRPAADKMAFGILPGCTFLGVPDLYVANEDDALTTMRLLKCSIGAQERLKKVAKENDHWTPGFSDLIAMAAPAIRFRSSQFTQLPAPAIYHHGLTYEREGLKIFHHRLQQYILNTGVVSSQTHWVLQQYEQLRNQFVEWEDETAARGWMNFQSLEFLEQVHDCWDETTRYFQEWQNRTKAAYVTLLTCHIEHTAGWIGLPRKNTTERREYFDVIKWIAEGMHIYFDQLPRMVEYMRGRGVDDGDLVVEAWFTLMFRAFCWHRLHDLVPGPTIPSVYYGSKMPIYIG